MEKWLEKQNSVDVLTVSEKMIGGWSEIAIGGSA
jgi:hypothetical protein